MSCHVDLGLAGADLGALRANFFPPQRLSPVALGGDKRFRVSLQLVESLSSVLKMNWIGDPIGSVCVGCSRWRTWRVAGNGRGRRS